MPTLIALLRGVNVGRNTLKMERLREVCSDHGLKNVRTYVQSGNIVFDAPGSPVHWSQVLEGKLAGETRLPVSVFVRTVSEMAGIVAGNPFLKENGVDPTKLHVTFLQHAPRKLAIDALGAIKAGSDRFRCAGKEIYLHCPDGYGTTKLSNAALERVLSLRATTRNWNTVNKLYAMCAECDSF